MCQIGGGRILWTTRSIDFAPSMSNYSICILTSEDVGFDSPLARSRIVWLNHVLVSLLFYRIPMVCIG